LALAALAVYMGELPMVQTAQILLLVLMQQHQ
jgi:hypothetical protein